MFCPKCGREVANGSAFCSACGADIRKSAQTLSKQGNYNYETPQANYTNPTDAQKRKLKFWGAAAALVLSIILLFNNFTGVKGAWKLDYVEYNGERHQYNEAEEGYRGFKIDSDTITVINGDHREEEAYYEDNGYLYVDGSGAKVKCNGFKLKLIHDNEVNVLSRVWEFNFVIKILVLIAMVAGFGYASLTLYRKM